MYEDALSLWVVNKCKPKYSIAVYFSMAPLNKKDSTEKQIRQIAKQLKENGAIINEIAENIADKKQKKAPRPTINSSLN